MFAAAALQVDHTLFGATQRTNDSVWERATAVVSGMLWQQIGDVLVNKGSTLYVVFWACCHLVLATLTTACRHPSAVLAATIAQQLFSNPATAACTSCSPSVVLAATATQQLSGVFIHLVSNSCNCCRHLAQPLSGAGRHHEGQGFSAGAGSWGFAGKGPTYLPQPRVYGSAGAVGGDGLLP